jgi:hypothetical protein
MPNHLWQNHCQIICGNLTASIVVFVLLAMLNRHLWKWRTQRLRDLVWRDLPEPPVLCDELQSWSKSFGRAWRM